jgi:glycosyltransferase involved in cell wall biosynthesis
MDNNNKLAAPAQISVCIVVLNGNDSIAQALQSVVDQNYPALELIVIDGGSTDGTLETVRRFSPHIQHLISEPDRGIYDAMNKARERAQGDWLIFLGCDDVMLDGVLAPFADCIQQRDVIYYGNVIVKSTGQPHGGPFSKYRMMQENIGHQAMLYPRAVYKSNEFSMEYRFFADYEYNIRLKGRGIGFQFLDIDVAIYNDTGASSQGDAKFSRDKLRLIRRHFGLSWAALKLLRAAVVIPYRLLTSKLQMTHPTRS